MAEREIVVTIYPDGRMEYEVCGVEGSACVSLLGGIDKILGRVTKRTMKPEFYRKTVDKTQEVRGG